MQFSINEDVSGFIFVNDKSILTASTLSGVVTNVRGNLFSIPVLKLSFQKIFCGIINAQIHWLQYICAVWRNCNKIFRILLHTKNLPLFDHENSQKSPMLSVVLTSLVPPLSHAKDFLKAQFQNWYAEQVATYIGNNSR
jgi:hypothetical protein